MDQLVEPQIRNVYLICHAGVGSLPKVTREKMIRLSGLCCHSCVRSISQLFGLILISFRSVAIYSYSVAACSTMFHYVSLCFSVFCFVSLCSTLILFHSVLLCSVMFLSVLLRFVVFQSLSFSSTVSNFLPRCFIPFRYIFSLLLCLIVFCHLSL